MGAVDLRLRYIEVHHWFAGVPAYGEHEEVPSAYAPAAFAILWPFLGWLSFSGARWVWALTSVAAIVATILAFLRGSMANSPIERALIAALVVGTYPVGATIGNGQLALHVLACTIWSVLWIACHGTGIRRFVVVPLVVFSMVKPSSALPFLIVALFLPGGLLPILISAVVYVGLTFFAAAYQPADLISLLRGMSAETNHLAHFTGTLHYANVHAWLAGLGLNRSLMPVSIVVLLLFTAWVFLNRKADIWLLMGVSAIVTRMWTYHRWYDDVLILVPLIALFRLMKANSASSSTIMPEILFWSGIATMLAPGGLYILPGLISRLYTGWESLLWLAYLLFLAKACVISRLKITGYSDTGASGFQGNSI